MYMPVFSYVFMLQISNKRFVSVRMFQGRFLVDIREYWYDDAGTRKPGKKGRYMVSISILCECCTFWCAVSAPIKLELITVCVVTLNRNV